MFSSKSAELLAELRSAHSALLHAVRRLNQLGCGPTPSERDLIFARSQVSKARIERRLLLARVLGHLAPSASRRTELKLRSIQESDINLLQRSVDHVSRWKTPDAIVDWRRFGSESARLLQQFITHVELEKRVLYPILKELERESA